LWRLPAAKREHAPGRGACLPILNPAPVLLAVFFAVLRGLAWAVAPRERRYTYPIGALRFEWRRSAMPIHFTYDPQLMMLLTSAEGLVSFEDIQKHLDKELPAGAIGCREIFDALAASTNLTPEQIREIVGRVRAMMRNGPFGPTAIITTNDLFFGMARMFAIMCELGEGPKVGVFRAVSGGLAWLCALPQ
jgi:hypothetical protein